MAGILAALVAILLPTAARIRGNARDVVCLSRLRGLATAAVSYKTEHRRFPQPARLPTPSPATTGLLPPVNQLLAMLLPPERIDAGLLNQLAPYAGYPPIRAGLAAIDLPAEVQSPEVEAVAEGRGPLPLGGTSTYHTGFVYPAALYDRSGKLFPPLSLPPVSIPPVSLPPVSLPPVPVPPVAIPPVSIPPVPALPRTGKAAASAPAGPVRRMVLWADVVHRAAPDRPGGAALWEFTHAGSRAVAGPDPLTYTGSAGCRGQHRAYFDLSTEWVPAEALDLDPAAPHGPGDLPVRIGAEHWWF